MKIGSSPSMRLTCSIPSALALRFARCGFVGLLEMPKLAAVSLFRNSASAKCFVSCKFFLRHLPTCQILPNEGDGQTRDNCKTRLQTSRRGREFGHEPLNGAEHNCNDSRPQRLSGNLFVGGGVVSHSRPLAMVPKTAT